MSADDDGPFGTWLAPRETERAVLSVLATLAGGAWGIVSGSLLTMPAGWALRSWPMWRRAQPRASAPDHEGFDLGPSFDVQPFPGLRAVRSVVPSDDWHTLIAGLNQGYLKHGLFRAEIVEPDWSAPVLITQGGVRDGDGVVLAAQRPVRAVLSATRPSPMPGSDATWSWPLPPRMKPGPDLGRIAPLRRLLHWPRELLGIDWLGLNEYDPPRCFAVGRLQHVAWIARVKPDYKAVQLGIDIGWDERVIDPLSCALHLRSEADGFTLLDRHIRISDLPGHASTEEPRFKTWSQRTLTVNLPRAARRDVWGLSLFGPNGQLLDARPLAPRYEQVKMSIGAMGEAAPMRPVAGDLKDPPARSERERSARAAAELEAESRMAASARRLSTVGELEGYLRWRFACTAGELVLLDPFLVAHSATQARELEFLRALKRPIRALTTKIDSGARAALAGHPEIDVARLPDGVLLHDRVWMVGETGLLVGASLNGFLQRASGATTKISTAAELPHADAVQWRSRFETWWINRRA